MSKFFQAIERAKRERLFGEKARRREPERPDTFPGSSDFSGEEVEGQRAKLVPGAPVETEAGNLSAEEKVGVARPGPTQLTIPPEFLKGIEEHLVSLLTPISFEAEQYRTLRYIVEHLRKESGLQVVAVTSPAAGDGKTTTAINLAGALAQSPETRVLLMDADLRRPTLEGNLGMDSTSDSSGLVEALLDPSFALRDAVQFLPTFNLAVLSRGNSAIPPHEVLKLPRLGELLAEAREQYDFIVLDTPPMLPVPDCRLLAKLIDGFILVVAAHKTPRKLLEETLNVMDQAKLVGLVLNRDDRPLSGHYGYYYSHSSPQNGGQTNWRERVLKGW